MATLLSYSQALDIRHPEEPKETGLSRDYSVSLIVLITVLGFGLTLYILSLVGIFVDKSKKANKNIRDIEDIGEENTSVSGIMTILQSAVSKMLAVYILLMDTSLFLPSFQSSVTQIICNARPSTMQTSSFGRTLY